MTYAVRFYTKTGNTKRLAEAIAKELGVEALPISNPVDEKVDVLFIGLSAFCPYVVPTVSRIDDEHKFPVMIRGEGKC